MSCRGKEFLDLYLLYGTDKVQEIPKRAYQKTKSDDFSGDWKKELDLKSKSCINFSSL